jgi:DNA-binding NtrC family response regulator
MVILVVDPSTTPRVVGNQLFKDGHEVIVCVSIEEALKVLETTRVDLVFNTSTLPSDQGLTECVDRFESQLVFQAMERSNHNQVKAARLLKITRGALQYKLKKYNYHKPETEVFLQAA